MLRTESTHSFREKPPVISHFFQEDAIFFDIETTGFSPKTSQLYLIGYSYRSSQDTYTVVQLFAETPEEEKQILDTFCDILKDYTTIITFNGIGFDVPYLKEKCKRHQVKEDFDEKNYLDIYKKFCQYQTYFSFENRKQKTLEHFLEIKREDKMNGGELIPVYKAYVLHPSEEGKRLLLLHNYEDVLGMVELLQFLAYSYFFENHFSLQEYHLETYTDYTGKEKQELLFTLRPPFSFPRKISFSKGSFYFLLEADSCHISIPLEEKDLLYFFPNPENYYYLPEEDMAIHKSVATYVDKSQRKKATKNNCYQHHTGYFLPNPFSECTFPVFYTDSKKKISYLEYDATAYDQDFFSSYFSQLFYELLQKKSRIF